MFPALRPGDKVLVRPLKEGEIPVIGSIVVVCTGVRRQVSGNGEQDLYPGQNEGGKDGGLVMHRLIEIISDNSDGQLFITLGDSRTESDRPWLQKQLIGTAVSYKRGKKDYPLKTFIPGMWRYSINRKLLWLYGRFLRLRLRLRLRLSVERRA